MSACRVCLFVVSDGSNDWVVCGNCARVVEKDYDEAFALNQQRDLLLAARLKAEAEEAAHRAAGCTHAESDMETIMPKLMKYSCRLCGEKWMVWTGRVCRSCERYIRLWDGVPLEPAPKVNETSLVKFAFDYHYCRECDPRGDDLRAGRLIEFRQGFAFLDPVDKTLHTAELRDGQWTVFAVNAATLEKQEVARSH